MTDSEEEGALEEKVSELAAEISSGNDGDYAQSDISSHCTDLDIEDVLPFVVMSVRKYSKPRFGTTITWPKEEAVTVKDFAGKRMQFHVA